MKSGEAEKGTVLDEIIDNATALGVEGQTQLLQMAKGMAFTRACMQKQTPPDGKNRTA